MVGQLGASGRWEPKAAGGGDGRVVRAATEA